MKLFFEEYIYYHSIYFKKIFPKWNNWESHTIISLTICQTLIILNFLFFLIYGPLKLKGEFNPVEYFAILAIFFGLDYYNNKLYKGRFEEFDKKWKNVERRRKIIKLLIMVIFTFFCWGLLFINGWIYSRYK